MLKYYIFAAILICVIISVVVAGFIVGGTPISQRAISLDNTRLSDFSTIRFRVEDYYRKDRKLPAKLSDLEAITNNVKDPETKKEYSYQIVSDTSYKLCTDFSTDSSEVNKKRYNFYYSGVEENKHKKGYDCINYSIPDYILNQSGRSFSITPTPTPTPSNLQFVSPKINENLCLGNNYTIQWEGAKDLSYVWLYTYTPSPQREYYEISGGLPAGSNASGSVQNNGEVSLVKIEATRTSGSYTWKVGNTLRGVKLTTGQGYQLGASGYVGEKVVYSNVHYFNIVNCSPSS